MPLQCTAPALPFRVLGVALLAAAGVAQAGEPVLPLSDAQRRTAGIELARVQAPGNPELLAGAGGAGTLLSGQVVVPNASQDLLLAPVAGRLESVRVNPGERVRAGQVVARLYSPELLGLQRAYLAARSQDRLAQRRLAREESLLADGILAESRLEGSRAEAAQAAAALREARQLLHLAGLGERAIDALEGPQAMSALLSVAAPRAGQVLQQSARVGEQVQAGTPLLSVAALGLLWVELQATRAQAATLAVGDRVDIAGCGVPGRLIATGVQMDAASQTVAVRAQFSSAGSCVSPNQFVQVTVSPVRAAPALVSVPTEAVLHRLGKDYVFQQVPTGFVAVPVTVARRQGDQAWLSQGPALGSQVVGRGVAALKGRWLGLGLVAEESP